MDSSTRLPELRTQRLLAFARKLQNAADFRELLEAARDEACAVTGYQHVWFMVADDDSVEELRMIEVSGERRERAWEVAPVLKVQDDQLIQELIAADEPIVIADARKDPRTDKRVIERLDNRTLVNIPLRLLDKPFGVFGLGTFGDEGCRVPHEDELQYLVGMAAQIAVAAGRIRYLEGKARAATERLALERRLLQVQKLESLGMLAGGIAHDFNNLLTVIIASATLAEQQSDDPGLMTEIRAVLAAATRARDLTGQLLAMSRAQALDLKPLDLNSRLRQLAELAKRLLPETIAIDLIEGVGLPLTEGDASQLDQVFMNLFINARDAMLKGGHITIETEQVLVNGSYVQTHPWAKPGRYALVTVTDTGAGMPPDVLERLFEPFFTTKGPRAGTGLGLAVAYGIIQQHRGMLHCYSEVGVGTSFKIYLPALERLASAVGTKLRPPVQKGSERLLVAEDDDLVRAVAVRALERAGYQVAAVENGAIVCGTLAQESFDLLILDVVMPGMTCREVVARAYSLCPGIRIVLTSGYTAGANVAALVEETGFPLLRKPYDPDDMLRAVRGALDAGNASADRNSQE